jgi:hypothetical protein
MLMAPAADPADQSDAGAVAAMKSAIGVVDTATGGGSVFMTFSYDVLRRRLAGEAHEGPEDHRRQCSVAHWCPEGGQIVLF